MAKVKVNILKDWAVFTKGDSPEVDSQIAAAIIRDGIAKKHTAPKPQSKAKTKE